MINTSLPEKFAQLEDYVEEWSIRDEEGCYLIGTGNRIASPLLLHATIDETG